MTGALKAPVQKQREWEVKAIMPETSASYLVNWAGTDPNTNAPYQPSWVPRRYVNEAAVDEWEESKPRRARGDGEWRPSRSQRKLTKCLKKESSEPQGIKRKKLASKQQAAEQKKTSKRQAAEQKKTSTTNTSGRMGLIQRMQLEYEARGPEE